MNTLYLLRELGGAPSKALAGQPAEYQSVADLPESYKDALAGVICTFQARLVRNSLYLKAFTTLDRGTTEGRTVDQIRRSDGVVIWPYQFTCSLGCVQGIAQYQVTQ